MNDVAHVMLGAALVTIGVLAAALADRIRGLRIRRERATAPARAAIEVIEPELVPTPPPKSERERAPRTGSKTQQTAADDVIAALAAAGHKKQVATEAVWGCSAAERATIEDWTRAALRRCARGGML
jgi:hypothetical protein